MKTPSNRWLARDYSELVGEWHRTSGQGRDLVVDVLIVGSGYGAAASAYELAGCRDAEGQPIRVVVLERGREYLPGTFPARMADLPTRIRGRAGALARGGDGLFDLRLGEDLGVVTANGLGGGSLINAGVMEIPGEAVFDARWPAGLRQRLSLDSHFADAQALLGATADPAVRSLKKNQVLQAMGRSPTARYRDAAITVALNDKITSGGVRLSACKRCGDCATGCNYSAKESPDTNLLALASQQGAEIYTGATALRLQRAPGRETAWRVEVRHTDEKRAQREGASQWIRAKTVLLAAGTLGSTEILLRSQRQPGGPRFSTQLGAGFSANGDMLSIGYDHRLTANAMANEDEMPLTRGVGPTITGVLETEIVIDGRSQPIVIEELAAPGSLRRLTEELVTTANTLYTLAESDPENHGYGHPGKDPLAVQPRALRKTSFFAAMGDDGASGVLTLAPDDSATSDGAVSVVWPELKNHPLFAAQSARIADLLPGGRAIANPMWQLLPPGLSYLTNDQKGPLLTVHPLGGCRMADSAEAGVVDQWGRVFDPAHGEQGLHDGLRVLDGAIVPSALGTNPALTITALALRAAQHLRDEIERWQPPLRRKPDPVVRPVIADTESEIRERAKQTPSKATAEFTERLSGLVTLQQTNGQSQKYWSELTLRYEPVVLTDLLKPDPVGEAVTGARLEVKPPGVGTSHGHWSLYPLDLWLRERQRMLAGEISPEALADKAVTYPVSGSLTLMRREARDVFTRRRVALWAWLRNRGIRDTVQGLLHPAPVAFGRTQPGLLTLASRRLLDAWRLASHAGEVRLFEYDLTLERPPTLSVGHAALPIKAGQKLLGTKRITYDRPSNPWRQLQELTLTRFPAQIREQSLPVLKLDPAYLARNQTPLFRLTNQRDHTEALADVAALVMYFLRMTLSIHLWNGRNPEAPRKRAMQRLPGPLKGLCDPEIHNIEVDRLDGQPVWVRLTRYRHPSSYSKSPPPVVLLHGYSASGTTFAHPSLKPGLARYLAERGRDVWVVDLRSSCGMPTATHPWTFERVALADIPAAITRVCDVTGHPRVDVVAHCMSSAMFSMAVLSADDEAGRIFSANDVDVPDRFRKARQELPQRIRRAVFSQIGPVMTFTDANTFRAYVMSFLEQVLGPLPYRFRVEKNGEFGSVMMDRLLSTLPYPDDELLLENPVWPWRNTEHLATRHRIDALYGRTFSLARLSKDTLRHLDDFFGPLNLRTLAQVLHFSRFGTLTNRAGQNVFLNHDRLRARWTFPTMSLHGSENGLASPDTLWRMQGLMTKAGLPFVAVPLDGCGHQDSLIGRDCGPVFERIQHFFEQPDTALPPATESKRDLFLVHKPWLGPLLTIADTLGPSPLRLSLGADPGLGKPHFLLLMPMALTEAGWDVDTTRWQTLSARGGQAHPSETIFRIEEADDTDWFSLRLPDWCMEASPQTVAVWLAYPQSEVLRRDDPDFKHYPPLTWLTTGVRKAAEAAEPAAPTGHGSRASAVRKAMETEIVRIDRERTLRPYRGSRLPGGFLRMHDDRKQGSTLNIALGSCQYPAGLLDTRLAYSAWEQLAKSASSPTAAESFLPDLILMTGDQIYADATAGVFDPTLADDRYRLPHEQWLQAPAVRRVLQEAPMATLPDDHEFDDGWQPISASASVAAQSKNKKFLEEGLRHFLRYQRARGVQDVAAALQTPLSYHFAHKSVPIFMLDTRTRRSLRNSEPQNGGTLIDAAQRTMLRSWLLAHKDSPLPKVIVCPALLLPRRRSAVDAPQLSDSWDGYPASLDWLLNLIATESIRRIVLLSGDEHLGMYTRIQLMPERKNAEELVVHSLHTAGLYTPYRFAGALPAHFVAEDDFVGPTGSYRCRVETAFYPEAGFTRIQVIPQTAGHPASLWFAFGTAPDATLRWNAVDLD